jgi:hypothetical protein
MKHLQVEAVEDGYFIVRELDPIPSRAWICKNSGEVALRVKQLLDGEEQTND